MTIQLGSFKTQPCQSTRNDQSITRSIIWNSQTSIKPTPLYGPPTPSNGRPTPSFGPPTPSYGPIYGSGHECQFTPQRNKYSLDHQFLSFEEATRFCVARMNVCDIIVELTLKGTLFNLILG